MSVEKRVEILRILEQGTMGVRGLSGALRRRTENVIRSVNELEARGLVSRRRAPTKGKGRPRHLLSTTDLGRDFLRAYDALMLRPLRGRRADMERAAYEGDYARRLASRGFSPFGLLLELNGFVGDIDSPP